MKSKPIQINLEQGLNIFIEPNNLNPTEHFISDEEIEIPQKQIENVIKSTASFIANSINQFDASSLKLEFGIDFILKTGKITSLIVSGETKAALKITVEWNIKKSEPSI